MREETKVLAAKMTRQNVCRKAAGYRPRKFFVFQFASKDLQSLRQISLARLISSNEEIRTQARTVSF